MEGKENKWWKRTPSLPCLIGGKKSNILQVTIIWFHSLKFFVFSLFRNFKNITNILETKKKLKLKPVPAKNHLTSFSSCKEKWFIRWEKISNEIHCRNRLLKFIGLYRNTPLQSCGSNTRRTWPRYQPSFTSFRCEVTPGLNRIIK